MTDTSTVVGTDMRVDLLASGSKGNACLVRDENTCILIDCGGTKKYLMNALAEASVSLNDINALLITHDHSDHISQIKHFRDLTIYSPVEIVDTETLHVEPMKKFTVGSFTILPLALSHDALHTTGYVMENGKEKLVYITDTGYIKESYLPFLQDADRIVLECNHDVDMLMQSRRPQYVKARIYSDEGHLCNEDCADILARILSPKTKTIFLAHISREANTRELALETVCRRLRGVQGINKDLVICAAGQFEPLTGGDNDEEMDCGSVSCALGMECRADRNTVLR